MALQLLEHPGITLASGTGLDLPHQAARARAMWLAGRQQRPPLLLVVLLWARHCPDVVQAWSVIWTPCSPIFAVRLRAGVKPRRRARCWPH